MTQQLINSRALLIAYLLLSLTAAGQRTRQPARATQQNMTPTETFSIVIKKSERKLYLYRAGGGRKRLAKAYDIALGSSPVGHKQRQGDGATPEGDYYVTHKNPRSNFYLSLGLSYPNERDAESGLRRGLISRREHEAIVAAIKGGGKPPQNTKLGGDIFIHGGGASRLLGLRRDWTLGCVALENEDIKELFETVPVKTPVRIEP
jgi:murein L,D-transpeptidase YafK